MQLIRFFNGSPKEYADKDWRHLFKAPKSCPNCLQSTQFYSHGHYSRQVVCRDMYRPVVIRVRRFRCCRCGRTVSLLPSCVQPYRLVENRLIDWYHSGKAKEPEVAKWGWLLKNYRKQFDRWSLRLFAPMKKVSTRSPPWSDSATRWRLLTRIRGGMVPTTMFMVRHCRFTLFGKYRCHWPNWEMPGFPTQEIYSLRSKNGKTFVQAYEYSNKKHAQRDRRKQQLARRCGGDAKSLAQATMG